MRIVSVEVVSLWFYGDNKDEELAAAIAQRRSAFERANINEEFSDEELKAGPSLLITESQLADLMYNKQKLEVKGTSDTDVDRLGGVVSRLDLLVGKVKSFADSIPDINNQQFNEKVEVYTPGAGLMLFNSTMLLEDVCTDSLQASLDDGWRIIAACPQPDQRRPDYIMGRYDPLHRSEGQPAKREKDIR